MDIYSLFQMMIVTSFLLIANTDIHTCIKLNTLGIRQKSKSTTSTFLCLSQSQDMGSNVICHGLFYVQWVQRWLFVLLILVEL